MGDASTPLQTYEYFVTENGYFELGYFIAGPPYYYSIIQAAGGSTYAAGVAVVDLQELILLGASSSSYWSATQIMNLVNQANE